MSYWVFLLVSLLACSVGFYSYLWFISVGYGLAIAAIGVALGIAYHSAMTLPEWLACLLMVVYGCRLSGYLLLRERKSAAYRRVVSPELDRSKRVSFLAKLGLWVTCGLLYTLMTIPLYFRLQNGAPADAMLWIGLAVTACGIALEATADLQKSAAKRKNSRRFVDTGLYSFVRCPNYLGELMIWLGVLLGGVTALKGAGQWALAILGFASIVWVMFSGARRLEMRQDKNYGADPEYQKYVRTVPILIPFVPLYSVKKYKFLVG
ncbi:MAG: DUF1295 domain-containing protein [Clostridia bacterium]|nr:DUF1295 domain-containing protein [Clostridia bacterium]